MKIFTIVHEEHDHVFNDENISLHHFTDRAAAEKKILALMKSDSRKCYGSYEAALDKENALFMDGDDYYTLYDAENRMFSRATVYDYEGII